jgi:hypothetical protein
MRKVNSVPRCPQLPQSGGFMLINAKDIPEGEGLEWNEGMIWNGMDLE